MPLDKARHNDLVRETIIELVVAPPREILERAGAEHAAVAHRDVGRLGAAGVHGEDPARGVDGDRHRGPSCTAAVGGNRDASAAVARLYHQAGEAAPRTDEACGAHPWPHEAVALRTGKQPRTSRLRNPCANLTHP